MFVHTNSTNIKTVVSRWLENVLFFVKNFLTDRSRETFPTKLHRSVLNIILFSSRCSTPGVQQLIFRKHGVNINLNPQGRFRPVFLLPAFVLTMIR